MCRSGCSTQDCESYVACCRRVKVAYCNSVGGWDATRQKSWDSNLASYRSAVDEGIQPKSTRQVAVDAARRAADETGRASGVPDLGHLFHAD